MSTMIDERVVEMRFDNRQFEQNASKSISTLEKLKNALNFSGAAQSLEGFQSAVEGIDTNGLGNAIDSVRLKFSAFEVAVLTTISNITNRIVNAGIQLTKSLSIDQISAGWEKYANKTSSVQTIMAATAKYFTDTGEQMEYVNDQLDKLNWFTDETSYNFVDMVNNIGKFTSNNVKLDTAVTAMQGIATWAAKSGANANEASRAMYNLAQAISVGSVKLIDWKSIENANMATAEFKETVIQTALELGTLKKASDGTIKSMKGTTVSVENFSSTLSDAWFTSDVLLKTLSQYGGFTDILYEMTDAMTNTGITTSRVLDALEKFKDGTLDVEAFAEECGLSVNELSDYMERLADETMILGQQSFRAAQEAKTFKEAIDATADAVSTGWMNTFELIFGNYEEAKTLWTDFANFLYDIFAEAGNTRNAILEGWKEAGGRDDLFAGIKAGWESLMSLIKPIREAWDYIFPRKSEDERASGLVELTKRFKELMESFKLSERTSENLKRVFQGLFSILNTIKSAASALIKVITPGVKLIKDLLSMLTGGILESAAAFGDWLYTVNKAITENTTLINGINGIHNVVSLATEKIKDFVKVVKDWVETKFGTPDLSFITNFANTASTRLSPLTSVIGFFKNVLTGLWNVLQKVTPFISAAANAIGTAMAALGRNIANLFTGKGFNTIIDLFNTGLLASIVKKMKTLVDGLGKIKTEGQGIFDFIKNLKNSILDTFGAFQEKLKSETLIKIAEAIAIMAGSLLVLSMIDSEKLSGSLYAMAGLLVELFGSLGLFEKLMAGSKMDAVKNVSKVFIKLGASILILAIAMKTISDIDPNRIGGAILSIEALIAGMAGAAIALSKWGGKIETGILPMVGLAASVVILAKAVETLSALNTDEITRGVVAIGALLAELASFMLFAQFGNIKITQAAAIAILAESILILYKSVEAFGNMEAAKILQGIEAIAGILAVFSVFGIISSFSGNIVSMSVAMVIMANALKMLQEPLATFGSMRMDHIGVGLLAIGGSLGIIGAAMSTMPPNSISVAIGLIAVSGALSLITKVMKDIAVMKWNQLTTAMVTLGIVLGELAVSMNAMKGTLGGAAAMVVMTTALLMLLPVLKVLGGMEWASILKSLTALAGVFLIVGAAGAVLAPLTTTILGLSGALALLGVAIAAIGVGIVALSAGLTALSVAGVATITSAIASVEVFIIGILNLIRDSIASFIGVIKTVVLAICDVIISCAPQIAKTIVVVIADVLESLADNIPRIAHSLLGIVIGIIDALANDAPKVVQALVNLFVSIFSSVIDALKSIDTKVLIDAVEGLGLIAALMLASAGFSLIAPAAFAGIVELGVAIAELAIILTAIGALAQIPGLSWIINEGGNFLEVLGTAIGKFLGGLAGGIASGVSSQLPNIGSDLADFMTNASPFIEGAKSIDNQSMAGIKSLAEAILILTAADILDGLTSWFTGGSSIVTFGQELAEFGPYMAKYAESVTGISPDVVEASANAALTLAKMSENLPKTGGLTEWFTGEGNIVAFGQQLAEFGPYISQYADSVSGLNPDVVTSSANAAMALAELANNLPKSGGLLSWFSGETDLESFGSSLSQFGTSMTSYYDSVKGIQTDILEGVIVEIERLIAIANNMASLNTSGMTGFGTALKTMGNNGINELIDEFTNSEKRIATTIVSTLISASEAADTETKSRFKTSGNTSATTWIDGFVSAYGGYSIPTAMYNAGVGAAQGFINGLSSKISEAASVGAALGLAAYNAAKHALDIHSPSRKMGELGDNSGLGYINHLLTFVPKAYNAGRQLGEATVESISSAVDKATYIFGENLDFDPVITPTVDLAEVETSAQTITDLFNRSIGATIGSAITVSSNIPKKSDNVVSNSASNEKSGGNVYNFNQYNTSPKALSRIEIYRDTRNQFARFKEAVETS